MTDSTDTQAGGFAALIKPYLDPAAIGSLMLGMCSGFPCAMIGEAFCAPLNR